MIYACLLLTIRTLLNILFLEQMVGRRGPIAWPASSPETRIYGHNQSLLLCYGTQ